MDGQLQANVQNKNTVASSRARSKEPMKKAESFFQEPTSSVTCVGENSGSQWLTVSTERRLVMKGSRPECRPLFLYG